MFKWKVQGLSKISSSILDFGKNISAVERLKGQDPTWVILQGGKFGCVAALTAAAM